MKQNKFIAAWVLLMGVQLAAYAQDPRERHYYYEILQPSHEPKPKAEGFARERVTERLGRGLIALKTSDGKGVYLSWRLLKEDGGDAGFQVERIAGGKKKKLNGRLLTATTDFVDTAPVAGKVTYRVYAVHKGRQTNAPAGEVEVDFGHMDDNYTSIPLGENVKAGKVAVADLNGDGVYDYIVRTPASNVDPGMPGDMNGKTFQIAAYLSDGTHLWTKDLGLGIEPGIWYSPFVAYDFNGDGKAEIALKTAPADAVRNAAGRVDGGEEYLAVWDGMTGEEIARVDWPERNFRYGNLNRQNRNQIGIAYVDGKTPCIIAARGTYKLMVADAWQLNGNRLERLWRWDGDEENPVVRSQGAHSMQTGDVDGDGRDEILLGSCMLDDNGVLLWSSGLGHSDKAILTDIDPEHPGLEVLLGIEPKHEDGKGVVLLDAATGQMLWSIGHPTYHVGDAMAADIDPARPGLECFASEDKKGGSTDKYLLSSKGEEFGTNEDVPPCRNWVWWDADLLRETFRGDDNRWGAGSMSGGRAQQVIKWKGEVLTGNIQGDILMIADLTGDWREEIVTCLPGELRIYHTNIPAKDRRVTLMQDPVYRYGVAHRSMGYPQSPVPGFYLGE